MPPTTKASATGTGANSTALIWRPKITPSTAAGRNAISTLTAKRCAARSLSRPPVTRAMRSRNSQITASMAPVWIATSNSLALSS